MASFEEAYLPKTDPNEASLLAFGFVREGDSFLYSARIMHDAFLLQIYLQGKTVRTKLIEAETGEPYELYRVETAHGEYVGEIREAVKAVLLQVRNACYPTSWTRRGQACEILEYLKTVYNEEPDYPWQDEFGVIRRKDNAKWYGLFMPLPVSKLGIQEEREEIVLNIRHDGSEVDRRVFFPAYHMTKKTWVSMVLDGSVPTNEILTYIEESRDLAKKDKNRNKTAKRDQK